MGLRSGLGAQLGIVAESTYGTLVTVNRFYDFISETMKKNTSRIPSKGIRAGKFNQARSSSYGTHDMGAAGAVVIEPQTKQLGLWLQYMVGSAAVTGAGDPWTHTASIADMFGKSFTMQLGRPDITGTVQPFTYGGCKVAKWTIDNTVEALLQLTLDIDAASETNGTALAAASYPSTMFPFVFTQAVINVNGSPQDVTKIAVTGVNDLNVARYMLRGSGVKKEPIQKGVQITGTFETEFDGLTQYNRFLNANEISFDATWTQQASPLHSVKFTAPLIRIDGDSPTVGNTDIIKVSFPFTVLDDSAQFIYSTLDSAL